MFNREIRWYLLTALALVNLIVWVLIAGIVGLIVSDRIDMGVETLMRQGQATAVCVWDNVSKEITFPGAKATATDTEVARAPQPDAEEEAPVPTVIATDTPQPLAPTDANAEGRPTSPAYRPPQGLPTATTYVPPTATPPSQESEATPTTAPTPAMLTTPLLLSDPQITSLSSLEAEMDRSASGRLVRIDYQEEALNREVAALIQENPDLPYRNVHVDMKRDGVVLSGKVTILGFRLDAKATGTVSVENCLPQLQVEQVSLGGILTPRFVKDEVEKLLLEAMDWYPADHPLCLEQIVIEETKATIYGHRR
ncbi:MAG: hypothetical protein ACP5JJ_07630 [Anaerolineae bacterium]